MAKMPLLQLLFMAFWPISLAAETSVLIARGQPLHPSLDPESPKKFLGDYASDKQPGVNEHYVFKHPYPAVQERSEFARDYVQDANGDGGKYNNQMAYDVLRNKVKHEEKKLQTMKKKVEEESEELEAVTKKEKQAAKEANEAEKALKAAKQKAKEASGKADKIEGTDQAGGSLGEATKEVEKEMEDVEDCKKQLADAKEKLKKLMKAKEKRQESLTAAEVEQQEALEAATEAKSKAEAEETARKETKKLSEEKLAKEKAEHEKALESYEQELQDVKQTEADLARAAEKLKSVHGKSTASAGGVDHSQPKSSAYITASPATSTVLLLLAAIVACTD